ncbi:DnaA regulatory inactivator Hda [Dyella sp.]|uniref:DnaA regulatory inactivator Hda n=1 Tax=Dyella sp. TaxID=1869338 RepID=UPI002ED21D7F
MIPQLPLVLRWPRRQRFEHFYSGSNDAALAAVQAVAEGRDASWLYLNGPSGSGKSHLLMAACQVANERGCTVQYLPLSRLPDPAAAIRGVVGGDLLAIDDLPAIAGLRDAEHALFDVYNQSRAEGTVLLFAADAVPASLGLGLPDLRSRLGACQQVSLRPLDDEERRTVLKKHAADRGIGLDDTVLDWLFARYARDLGGLFDLFDKLDQASLAARRKVTVPFLREVLREYP